ncbi:hypothetical protein R6Q57_002698 [Mikania cordata]
MEKRGWSRSWSLSPPRTVAATTGHRRMTSARLLEDDRPAPANLNSITRFCTLFGEIRVIIAVPLLRRSTGYDSETSVSKRRETKLGVSIGNTRKRKSHASKRSVTMFVQADLGSFRQIFAGGNRSEVVDVGEIGTNSATVR